jgi:hypothetical protein
MTVTLTLHCGGCDRTAEGTGPLCKSWVPVSQNFSRESLENPEALTPDGWVMFDPYTLCTYCPDCWTSITEATA